MRLKLLFIAVALFVGLGSSYGQGSENFSNIPTGSSNSYLTRTWTGTNGVSWNATNARTDQTIAGKAICTDNSGTITSPTYTGGIGILTFKYVRAFTGTGVRSIDVWINGTQIGTTLTVSTSSDVVVNYSQAINITGNVVLELRTSGNQIKIDDISWTGYSDTPTQLALVSVPTTGTTGTPISSFTVEARNVSNVLVPSFTGSVTLTKASGLGNISGTLSANAVAGVATFNNVAFDQASTYTITAASTGLTSATSGNVVISNPSTNIYGGDGVNFVGQINGYSQPPNCTYGDYRVLNYRKLNTTSSAPSDGRGQWVTTVNVQASGGDVTPFNMNGGVGTGFLFTSGGGCGATGNYLNKWAFGGVGQGGIDAINGADFNGSTDMGFNMSTAGRYTFVLKDNGYSGTGYYAGYTTNTPVTITHNTGTQRTLNNDGTTTLTATISAANSSQEGFYVRYKTGSNDFSTGSSTISAAGTVAGTTVTFTIPVQADGASVYYYIFSSTMSQSALAALSEGDKSYALLNYADNSGSNYTYTALSLTPTVTSIVPTAVTGITGQASNTGFKGQTITINGANFQTNSTVTINGVAATSVTFTNAAVLTAVVANIGVNFTGNVVVTNPTPATSVTVSGFNFLGYIITGTGSINTASNWLGGSVPLANSTVTIARNQTLAAVTTNTPFAAVTILTGITLDISGASGVLTVAGAIITVGTGVLTFSAGGSVTSGSIVNAGTISFGTGASNANLITGSITNNGTMSWATAGILTIKAGGSFTNAGTVTSGTVGNVVFSGAGTINGTNAITFNNLTINGTTALTTIPTINGTLQINSGGSVTATPTYGSSSTLVYNTTGSYAVSIEWTGNGTTAGSGVPKNVTIQNNTTLTMPNSNRGLAGNLNISSGNLTLNATSGDLFLAGNWTNSGTFSPKGRAVTFNGTGTQTITNASGETFNYLINNKASGSLTLANNVTVNGSSGSVLQLLNNGGFDLNGKSLTLSSSGGDIQVTDGARTITSGTAATINISGYKNVSGTGTLILDTNVTTVLNSGFNCGTGNKTTINGTLQINGSGYIDTNAPIYGNTSLLKYSSGGAYDRRIEWNRNIGASFGVPKDVLVTSNTTLNYPFGTPGALGMTGNLTIDSGSSLFMDYGNVTSNGALTVSGNLVSAGNMTLGYVNGDDLKIGGDITFNTGYTFDAKNRAIFFTKTGTQIITASNTPTFNKILFTPASGTTTVRLASSPATSLNITTPLAGGDSIDFGSASNVFDINGNTLTLGTSGRTNTVSGANGTFKGSTTSNLTLLGTGSIGTLNFTPSFQILGNLTLDRQASNIGFDLGTDVSINGIFALTNGIANLGSQTMIITLAGTITGASSSNYIIADFTAGGILRKNFNTNGSFTFPIGDRVASTDGTQYSPATITFTAANYSSAWAALSVEDSVEPNLNAPTDFITRYWNLTSSGITSATYNFTGTYLPADISGTETNSVSGRYSTSNSTWTNGTNLVSGANTILLTGLTSATGALTDPNHFSAGNRNKEINITGSGIDIPSGSTTAFGFNNTLFGTTNIGSSSTKVYEIQNLGIAALNLTGTPIVSIGGANPGDFTVTSVPLTPIIGGSNTTFVITFSPTYGGIRTAIVSIANDDSTGSESPYTFLIQGTGTCNPAATNTITPTSGPVGTEVTITATANNLTGATATFNGTAATIVSSTATKLVVLVPAGATSGNLVTTNATGCQATNAFTVVDNKANTCEGGTVASDLFFSEVTDATTGGLSYIEIYNGTSLAINMNGYSIKIYSNGDTLSHTTLSLNNFSLSPGSMYIVAIGTTATPDTFNTCSITGGNGSLANQISTSAGINFDPSDNDYIALYKTASSSVVDSFGTFGSDNWADGLGLGDRGATFRRKNTASFVQPITFSNSDWNIINWDGTAQASCYTNDYSDIGVYNFISGTPPNVTLHPSYTPTCKSTTLTVAGTEGYSGGSLLTYKWLYSAPNTTGWTEISDDTNYTGSSTATLSIANISTVLNYQYYCQIRENTNTCYSASNAVKITNGAVATWNGSWTNGPPTLDKLVIINADYNTTTNGSFDACSVIVNPLYTLIITANEYVKIENDLTNNGTLDIENDGSLIQVNDNGVNTGNSISYERITPPVFRTDYTYWSSPVSPQTLYNVSPATLAGMFYSYDDIAQDWVQEASSNNMISGKGYIIRGPETPFQNPYTASFIGKPNNGTYSITGVTTDKSYLLGNPYPSALDAETFLDANSNVLDGTLYFWTHKTPLSLATSISNPGPGWAYTYSLNDYAAYNPVGGVGIDDVAFLPGGSPAPNGSAKPTGKIASGQGFFASSKIGISGSDIVFNNSMRVGVDGITGNNNQFFKTRNHTTKTALIEKHRIWLNVKNTQGAFKQTLIGYITNATNEYESRFDGVSFDANEFIDFYSINQDKNLVIQGRALPFNENDEVTLGYRTTITGAFTINIDQVDGVLTNQAVFIEDKLTNTVFDLKTEPYTFTTEIGTFNDRFILRYTNKTLSNNDFETLENQVLVSNKNKQIKVNSVVETIDKVFVYDLLGRQIYKKEKVNSNELTLTNFNSSQQTLLVKVTLQNGKTVTRKVMY